MRMRVRKQRGSRSVENAAKALRSIAAGSVLPDVASDMAPRIQKAMRSNLRPHRDTGAAEDRATATASGTRITIANVGYAKYIDGYFWARRFPRDWIKRLKASIGRAAKAALRGVT